MIKVMDQIDFYEQGIRLTYQFSPLSWHFFSVKINQGNFLLTQLCSTSFKKSALSKHKNLLHISYRTNKNSHNRNGSTKRFSSFWITSYRKYVALS